VGVQLGPSLGIADRSVLAQACAALVAILGLEVVLRAALVAVARKLAAGHSDEGPAGAVDDLQIANHEAVVKSYRAKALQPIVRVLHQLDSDLGYFHGAFLPGARLCCLAGDGG